VYVEIHVRIGKWKCGKFWNYVHHLHLSLHVTYVSNWLHQTVGGKKEEKLQTEKGKDNQGKCQVSLAWRSPQLQNQYPWLAKFTRSGRYE